MENNATLKTVRRIEEKISDIDRDMEKDRQRLQDINIRLQGVETQLETLRGAVNQNASRTKDKVNDVLEPVIESMDRLSGSIKKSKKVYIKEEVRKFWSLFTGKR